MAKYNPPEDFLYDEKSGFFYTQIITTDENGTPNQVVTWFDADSGQYSREVYIIDENTTIIDDEELQYLDGYESNRNKPAKQLSRGALIGIIAGAVVALALIVGIVIWANNKSEDGLASSDENTEETADGENTDNNTNSDQDGNRVYPEETETEGWIELPENGGRIPRAKDIEKYSVFVSYADSQNALGIDIWGVGNMESDFLCNPDGYNNGDIVYMWSIVLSEQCGIIATGRAHNCGEEKIWEPVNPEYYTAQLVYEKNGEKVYEDIDLAFGDDCVIFFDVHVPDGVGVDFTKLDLEGTVKYEVRNQIGPYGYGGVYAPVTGALSEVDEFVPSNKPHEEKSYDTPQNVEYETDGEYTEEEYATDIAALEEAGGYEQSSDSSSSKSTASPQAGMPASAFYRSDDGSVTMDIMDNGVIYYNSADSTRYEGWYTYDGGGTGYSDQGGIYNLHVHFNTPDGELRMELQIDTEVSGLQVLSGPGNYGNGWLWR